MLLLSRVRVGILHVTATALPLLESRKRGTQFHELSSRSILNTPESTGMGFWSANPYVGCEFGCSYCYARYTHRYVAERARDTGAVTPGTFADLTVPAGLEPFEHRIFVKRRRSVAEALERDLRRLRRRTERDGRQNLVIGSGTDPYQPAERLYQITRTILERLRRERGIRIGIITKSALVCRDIPLLRDLARVHPVSVYISLISVDAEITSQFEARSPQPHVRLRALARLTAAGIRAGLIVAPVLPGVTDSTDQFERLLGAARDAGARFALPIPLRLYPDARQRVVPLVAERNDGLAARYRRRFAEGWNVPDTYADAMRQRFHTIAARYGIPDTSEDREQPSQDEAGRITQLSLW
jgi:DNA repair photolyase